MKDKHYPFYYKSTCHEIIVNWLFLFWGRIKSSVKRIDRPWSTFTFRRRDVGKLFVGIPYPVLKFVRWTNKYKGLSSVPLCIFRQVYIPDTGHQTDPPSFWTCLLLVCWPLFFHTPTPHTDVKRLPFIILL